jgi:hypothetical protein
MDEQSRRRCFSLKRSVVESKERKTDRSVNRASSSSSRNTKPRVAQSQDGENRKPGVWSRRNLGLRRARLYDTDDQHGRGYTPRIRPLGKQPRSSREVEHAKDRAHGDGLLQISANARRARACSSKRDQSEIPSMNMHVLLTTVRLITTRLRPRRFISCVWASQRIIKFMLQLSV